MEEREFFNETEELKPAQLNCPSCRKSDTYDLRWVVRRKKPSLPPRASEDDRRKFAKASAYMVRKDDKATCKNPRCRKTFEVSGVQSVAMLTDLGQGGAHLPYPDEEVE